MLIAQAQSVARVCKQIGIADQAYYRRRARRATPSRRRVIEMGHPPAGCDTPPRAHFEVKREGPLFPGGCGRQKTEAHVRNLVERLPKANYFFNTRLVSMVSPSDTLKARLALPLPRFVALRTYFPALYTGKLNRPR